jgi:hypothetical protein
MPKTIETRTMVQPELAISVLFHDEGGAHLLATTSGRSTRQGCDE